MTDEAPRAQALIDTLGLKYLNVEAGLFTVARVSDLEVQAPDGRSPASNAIYLMLSRAHPQNHVQWLASDDYQVLIEGGPADYYLFYADGKVDHFVMGRDVEKGQQMMVISPGGTAKAIVLQDGADYLLVGSILSPAWSPDRARIGGDQAFVDRYSGAAQWATPAFIRQLIGPNFGAYVGGDAASFDILLDDQGQIIWQQMQLTEQQFLVQLRKYRREHPDAAVRLQTTAATPPSLEARVQALLGEEGVEAELR